MQFIERAVSLTEVPPQFRAQVFKQLKRALDLLHDNNYIFGDLREPNILVTRDFQKVMLIDFDWCGEQGKARYPVGGVNREQIKWPVGVETNGLIEKKHDRAWFKYLSH